MDKGMIGWVGRIGLAVYGLAWAATAAAHPHAFMDMQTRFLVENHQLTGFAVRWTLDEASSAAVLYDLALAGDDVGEKAKLEAEMADNIVNEHYFSYFYDEQGNKIKYRRQPDGFALHADGERLVYEFSVQLVKPQPLQGATYRLQTYDATYYVAMIYPGPAAVDFSALPLGCRGAVIAPKIDDKIRRYASSLDKTQRDEDDTLGVMFAQQLEIQCD